LHDLGEPALATETAGHVGHPLLSPTDAVQFQNTERSLRRALGQQYEAHHERGRNRSTRDLITSILDTLQPA